MCIRDRSLQMDHVFLIIIRYVRLPRYQPPRIGPKLRSLPFLICLCSATLAPALTAQVAENRSAQATRAQIEQALASAQQILSSPGYSGRIKDAKRREIVLLKSRLEDGDLQPGDQVAIQVTGEQTLTGSFIVSPTRTISMPGLEDLSLRRVLRSEMQDAITAHLRKYIKDPTVHVTTTIRISFLGGVGKPGYYQVASELIVGDAIMAAGGPGGGVDPANTTIERAGVVIMPKEAFRQALIDGKTLDQLNLRAGDEFLIGGYRVQ